MTNSKKEEILSETAKTSVCNVSTYSGTQIRNRMMHFAVSSEFEFYLTSMKTDPKTEQILLNPEISLLVHIPGETFPENKEIEVMGVANLIKDKEEREKAVEFLIERSPVVAQLKQYGKLDMLSFIKVLPRWVKFRHVKDVLEGVPPTVIEFERSFSFDSDLEKFKRKIKAWIHETRYPFLTITVVPVLLGTAVAWAEKSLFNLSYFLLTLLGAVCLHLGTNMVNDYFDHKSGNDQTNNEFVRPFSGGARMIQLGLLTPLEVLIGAILFFILGSAIGIYLTVKCGLFILLLGLIGVVSGFFYTSPVFNWASKGIGELLVGLNFGVLISIGSYYVQTGIFSPVVFWASLPLGILITSILWINGLPDFKADKKVGKNTLVVRLGRKTAAGIFGYLILGSYLLLGIGIAAGYLPPLTLIALVTLPLAFRAAGYAKKYYDNPFEMAPGNGFTIICFNVVGLLLVFSFLLNSAHMILVLGFSLISAIYILWNWQVIKSQKETFMKLKEIV